MEQARSVPVGNNIFWIQMNLQREQAVGWVAGAGFRRITPFSGFSQLLLMLEERLDALSPARSGPLHPPEGWHPQYELRVLMREHYSWQGVLCRLDTQQQMQFRSVLELLLLFETMTAEQKGSDPLYK